MIRHRIVALFAQICFLAAATTHSFVQGDNFTIGYLLRATGGIFVSGLSVSGAITIAVDEINQRDDILPGHHLNFVWKDTTGTEDGSIGAMLHQLFSDGAIAILGPPNSCTCEAKVAYSLNLPMISYMCDEGSVSDKTKYGTFMRTNPTVTQSAKSLIALLKYFDWRIVTLIVGVSDDTSQSEWEALSETLQIALPKNNITIKMVKTFTHPYYPGYSEFAEPFPDIIEDTYLETRIYIFLGTDYERNEFLRILQKNGLLEKGEYLVIGVEMSIYDKENPTKYVYDKFASDWFPTLEEASRSLLIIIPSAPTNENYTQFEMDVDDALAKPPFNFNPSPDGVTRNIFIEAAYLYDAVYLYAEALTEILEDGIKAENGSEIFKRIAGRKYQSITGSIGYIDENGDAEGNFTLLSLHKTKTGTLGMLPSGKYQKQNSTMKYVNIENIDWVGGGPPVSEPACGFKGEKCGVNLQWIIRATAIVAFVAILIGIAICYRVRNKLYERKLDGLLWKVDQKAIHLFSTLDNRSSFMSFNPRASIVSEPSGESNILGCQLFASHVASYKGNFVALKFFSKPNADISRETKKELNMMKALRHDNVCTFVGASVGSEYLDVLYEYCSRGSLQDILENDDNISLDMTFKASLINDIIKGMVYLHDSEIIHNNLKSSNCVIDSRWILKITDFGLLNFREDMTAKKFQEEEEIYYRKLLWKAPELLPCYDHTKMGSQEGDIYSFAIILYEIALRNGPYGNCELGPKEIIMKVKRSRDNPGLEKFRPNVQDLIEAGSEECIVNTIQDCWHHIPEERPDFKEIKNKLKPLKQGMKSNFVDHMIFMLEKYSNNLEMIVEERTRQLQEEKKKTDNLLHNMLPKTVADQLKKGESVQAEAFDCVTIYFSDIVGFTSISAESTPWQIVDMLNDLYSLFDSIIQNYDTYKVETIGDAYLVCSGLPLRNGDKHAGEIALTALQLLKAVSDFKIRHKPDVQLELRIGIHSGPVCAGVVGITMPRYCLFGDTVNTASRMETNGIASKIHCSEESTNILERLGGYLLEERGLVEMKGKGKMLTYWLEGTVNDMENRTSPEMKDETEQTNTVKESVETLDKKENQEEPSDKDLRKTLFRALSSSSLENLKEQFNSIDRKSVKEESENENVWVLHNNPRESLTQSASMNVLSGSKNNGELAHGGVTKHTRARSVRVRTPSETYLEDEPVNINGETSHLLRKSKGSNLKRTLSPVSFKDSVV